MEYLRINLRVHSLSAKRGMENNGSCFNAIESGGEKQSFVFYSIYNQMIQIVSTGQKFCAEHRHV
jgi:hypothetical protein